MYTSGTFVDTDPVIHSINKYLLRTHCVLLRITWTAKRSNQSILKEISPGCSLEELTLKLRLQYFGHLMQRDNALEKALMLGKTEGRRKSGRQRMSWLTGIIDSVDTNVSKIQEIVKNREAWHAAVHGVTDPWGPTLQRVGHDLVTQQQKGAKK